MEAAALRVARVCPAETLEIVTAPFVHLFVARQLEGAGALATRRCPDHRSFAPGRLTATLRALQQAQETDTEGCHERLGHPEG
ncbi:hypothetical protein Shyhy02_71810 [Streptomyces hygroscopicus subsp. hygroscopicus]|nr:hypothetical protein Shyhy02_71810 [Streptomyces hygroscopicus subsp. hygroscopicus]